MDREPRGSNRPADCGGIGDLTHIHTKLKHYKTGEEWGHGDEVQRQGRIEELERHRQEDTDA